MYSKNHCGYVISDMTGYLTVGADMYEAFFTANRPAFRCGEADDIHPGANWQCERCADAQCDREIARDGENYLVSCERMHETYEE